MNTFAFNRVFIPNNVQFVAACDHTCDDLLGSYNMDKRIHLEANTGTSFCTKLKHFFLGK